MQLRRSTPQDPDRANALSDNVRFHRWPTNRVWTRDSGCTFVVGVSPREGRGGDRPTSLEPGALAASNGVSMPGPNIPTGSATKKSAA